MTAPVSKPPSARRSARPGAAGTDHAPPASAVGEALGRHDTLAALLARIRASQERYAAVAHLLPESLASAVRAGPLDEAAWVLLADHAAAAAKLRQSLPRIEAALQEKGWFEPAVKVKVRPRS